MPENQLYAGAGTARIGFPVELFPLEGFSGEIHDAPAVRVLLLEQGERAAIVAAELVMLLPSGVACVKENVAAATGTKPENIWVHTTHAVSTPHEPHAPWGGPKKELSEAERGRIARGSALYLAALRAAVQTAAEAALAALRPARLGVDAAECRVNVSREVETPFGRWTGFAPEGDSDHTAALFRLEDDCGGLLASVVCFGMKAGALDNAGMKTETRVVSGDVPGRACTLLEERLGAPCLYLMGAACDQIPRETALYDTVGEDGAVRTVDLGAAKGLEIAERLGGELAETLAPAIERICCTAHDCPVRSARRTFEWRTKRRTPVALTKHAEYSAEGGTELEVLAMTVGGAAFCALRQEVNAVTERELREASPFAVTRMVTMVNGSSKYMPDRAAYENAAPAAQGAMLMPGAAERWVAECVSLLREMKGTDGGNKND